MFTDGQMVRKTGGLQCFNCAGDKSHCMVWLTKYFSTISWLCLSILENSQVVHKTLKCYRVEDLDYPWLPNCSMCSLKLIWPITTRTMFMISMPVLIQSDYITCYNVPLYWQLSSWKSRCHHHISLSISSTTDISQGRANFHHRQNWNCFHWYISVSI